MYRKDEGRLQLGGWNVGSRSGLVHIAWIVGERIVRWKSSVDVFLLCLNSHVAVKRV